MKFTNKLNLPQPLVDAVTNDEYTKGQSDITTTELSTPVRIRQLRIRHNDEIAEDVSDRIWALLGQIGHKILERANTHNHLSEERIYATIAGWKVGGQIDLLSPQMTLDDYKFTSVWAVKDGKKEWEEQANINTWLFRQNGFEVKQARIIAILRDWSLPKAAREPNYPPDNVVVREIPLWTPEQQREFVIDRVNAHQVCANVSDDQLPLCTPEERWSKPDTWAVKKKGNKRASKVCYSELEAQAHTPEVGFEIEYRPGEDTRCLSHNGKFYCPVVRWCAHGRKVNKWD